MKISYRKKFLTDLAVIPAKVRRAVEKFAFEEMPHLNLLGESGKAERMKGYKSYYKARFGSYRVGLRSCVQSPEGARFNSLWQRHRYRIVIIRQP